MAFDRVFIMSINIDIELCIDPCIYFLSLMWASVANNLPEKKNMFDFALLYHKTSK